MLAALTVTALKKMYATTLLPTLVDASKAVLIEAIAGHLLPYYPIDEPYGPILGGEVQAEAAGEDQAPGPPPGPPPPDLP